MTSRTEISFCTRYNGSIAVLGRQIVRPGYAGKRTSGTAGMGGLSDVGKDCDCLLDDHLGLLSYIEHK